MCKPVLETSGDYAFEGSTVTSKFMKGIKKHHVPKCSSKYILSKKTFFGCKCSWRTKITVATVNLLIKHQIWSKVQHSWVDIFEWPPSHGKYHQSHPGVLYDGHLVIYMQVTETYGGEKQTIGTYSERSNQQSSTVTNKLLKVEIDRIWSDLSFLRPEVQALLGWSMC